LYETILHKLNKMRLGKDCKYVWVLTFLLCIDMWRTVVLIFVSGFLETNM